MEELENKILELPLIPLRGLVVYPHMSIHFDIGRSKSILALNTAVERNDFIMLAPQTLAQVVDPLPADILSVGTIAKVKQVIKLSGDNVRVLVQGLYRASILSYQETEDFYTVSTMKLESTVIGDQVFASYTRNISGLLDEYAKLDSKVTPEVLKLIKSFENDSEGYIDTICGILIVSESERQALLCESNTEARLTHVIDVLNAQMELCKLDKKISGKVKKSIEQNQKEYYLHEQMKAISDELGEGTVEEITEFGQKIKALGMPKELEDKVLKEIARLNKMQSSSPEATIIRSYVDWIIDLPWSAATEDNPDLKDAAAILDNDHFGLEKVKERIVEYLAVIQMTNRIRGPILCFVGPPGVGKTSIAKSIARALHRKFVRMSLGGVKDEAEIRGHRKTYIGAIPGRILYHMKSAGSINPVFLLDEIDKMSSDYRGDPASAMLEVLDPEQNFAFCDHFLEIPYDLSKVMFICTANSADTIPAPLLDRMELINLSGYSEEEKLEIAKQYLVPKQEQENGLQKGQLVLNDLCLRHVISDYTRESGVRSLEREIGTVCRKVVRKIVESGIVIDKNRDMDKAVNDLDKIIIEEDKLVDYLGVPTFSNDELSKVDEVGAATGLAWTAVGGTTLTIEVAIVVGKGEIVLTGKLGDVMKESARTALSLVRSRAIEWGINPSVFQEKDIHIHVPEGAIPKDGPSAGITIATAILSALTNMPVDHRVAMTGEVTLRGKVLGIGGLKEKTLAARRAGIKTIIIPKQNEKDIVDLPDVVKRDIELIVADNINVVFENSLVRVHA